MGCTRTIVQPTLPCPPRPILESTSTEDMLNIYPDKFVKLAKEYSNDPLFLEGIEQLADEQGKSAEAVILGAAKRQLKLKTYAKKLEVRAGCEIE